MSTKDRSILTPLLLFCTEVLIALGENADSEAYGIWFNPSCLSDGILASMIKHLLPLCLDNLQQITLNKCSIYEQLLVNSCYCIAMLPRKHFSILVSSLLLLMYFTLFL